MFSYPISGKGNTLLDLLFLGTIPSNVTEEPSSRRKKTGSIVLKFDGCEGILRKQNQETRIILLMFGGFILITAMTLFFVQCNNVNVACLVYLSIPKTNVFYLKILNKSTGISPESS